MKNFLSLKRLRKPKKAKKMIRVKVNGIGLFKGVKTYPVYIMDLPIDENCPFLVKKLEEAYRTFEEAPMPDFLVERAGPKIPNPNK